MFYSEVILARKGPLGKIWLAAHFDKKLTKKQIFSTDISSSVESVLNPANPLALRVSGHLMLGIVRIYSRKMKYLVTDCADAMWKIDLAFRPKNVDIDPTIAQIIDDARHFGNVSFDNEFPELENTAFPQDLLSGYDYPRLGGSRFSGSSFGENDADFNDYSLNAESPLFTRKSGPTGSSSRHSVASDIELTRGIRGPSLTAGVSSSQQQGLRGSLSSMKSARPFGLSLGAEIEDDVPVLHDFDQDYGAGYEGMYGAGESEAAPAGGLLWDLDNQAPQEDELPPFDNDYLPNEEEKMQTEGELVVNGKANRESLRVQKANSAAEALRLQREAEREAEEEEEDEEEPHTDKHYIKKARKRNKPDWVIDDTVELPSRVIKQRRANLDPILRSRGTDTLLQLISEGPTSYAATRAQRNHLLHASPLGSRTHLPAGVRGMCAELQEVFGMSTNAVPLPFPLKDGVVATPPPSATVGGPRGVSSSGADNQAPDYSIEHTRAPRDSEMSVAGRMSLLSARDGPMSASKSANASYMDGGATEGGYQYNPDFGDYNNFDDSFTANYTQPPQDQELMNLGDEEGAEEVKLGDSANRPSSRTAPQREIRRALSIARNDVSDLICNTFAAGAELDSRSGGSGNHSGSGSGSRHTRTEQFMDILDDEFRRTAKAGNKGNKGGGGDVAVVSFDHLSAGVSKRVAAACFLEVLQLKTWGRIRADQEAPFEDILLRPTSSPSSASSGRVMVGGM